MHILRIPAAIGLTAALLCLGACSSGDDEASPAPTPGPVAGPAAGTVESFVELGFNTEGLAFGVDEQGASALYVGRVNAGLFRVRPDGSFAPFGDVPAPVGIARRADDRLLVCGKNQPGGVEAVIWLVEPSGSKSLFASGGAAPFGLTNFVAIAPDDRVVFTDSASDVVYAAEADGQNLTVVTTAITYPNGLAFSPSGDTLYVASWDTTTVYAIPRSPSDGSYGAPAPYVAGVSGVDGLVTMLDGDLLLITTGAGIVRVATDGTMTTVASGPSLTVPANGAFGSAAFDPRWLYVTNVIGTTIDRVRFDESGVELPVR